MLGSTMKFDKHDLQKIQDVPPANNQFKLLLLSGGSLVGQNIVAALSSRRGQCLLMSMNSKADEPAIFDYDETYLAPPLVDNKEAFQTFFEDILVRVKPDVVIPCRDEDVAFLAEMASQRPELRHQLLCGDIDIARSMLDKASSWTFSKAHGLPFAAVIETNANIKEIHAFVAEHGLPILAKPRKGFASQGVRILSEQVQLEALIGRDDYILQRYLGDPAIVAEYSSQLVQQGIPLFHTFEETKISVQGCIGPNGELGGVFVTENIMQQGKSAFVSTSNDAIASTLASEWVATFANAGWRGPINIQCQRDQDGNIAIYEYNGRFTGATSARILLGFDEVGITLGLWLGDTFPKSGIDASNNAVVRTPVSRAVDTNRIQTLEKHQFWLAEKTPAL